MEPEPNPRQPTERPVPDLMGAEFAGERPSAALAETPARPYRLFIALALAVGGFWMLVGSMGEGGVYLLTVDELAARAPSDRPLRVKGDVKPGSYQNEEGTSRHAFTIIGKENSVDVLYEGPLPDVFAEAREVVAEGRLDAEGRLVATEVTAKCPSKYEEGQMSDEAREQLRLNPPADKG